MSCASTISCSTRSKSSATAEGVCFGGAGGFVSSLMAGLVEARGVADDRATGAGVRGCLCFGVADGVGGLGGGADAQTGWRRLGAAPGTARLTGASWLSALLSCMALWNRCVEAWNLSAGLSLDAKLTGVSLGSGLAALGLPPFGVAAESGSGLRECLPLVQFLPR